eukprot:COSAG05_NODE_2243_length_3350_cov_1.245463_1_plen_194_part_00
MAMMLEKTISAILACELVVTFGVATPAPRSVADARSSGSNSAFYIGGFIAPSVAGPNVPLANITGTQKEAYWASEKAVLEEYAAAGFTFIESGPGCIGTDITPASVTSSKTAAQADCLARWLDFCKSTGIATFLSPNWAGGTATKAEQDDVLVGYVSLASLQSRSDFSCTVHVTRFASCDQNIADEPMNPKCG